MVATKKDIEGLFNALKFETIKVAMQHSGTVSLTNIQVKIEELEKVIIDNWKE